MYPISDQVVLKTIPFNNNNNNIYNNINNNNNNNNDDDDDDDDDYYPKELHIRSFEREYPSLLHLSSPSTTVTCIYPITWKLRG